MTKSITAKVVGAGNDLDWPSPNTPVLLRRKLNPAADPATLTVFADERWNLTPGLFEEHVPVTRLNFGAVPIAFREPVKHYFWQVINHDTPRRMRKSMSPRPALRTVAINMPRLAAFTSWLDGHGVRSFAEVTTQDLDLYLTDVVTSDASDSMKSSLLTEVIRFWSYRTRLPEPMRMLAPPPWDGEQPRDLIGVVVKIGTNRTPRIAADTMESLLMWSLRFVEDLADDIIAAFREFVALHNHSPSVRNPEIKQAFPRRTTAELIPDLTNYLAYLQSTGGSLPGRRDDDGVVRIHYPHLTRMFRGNESSFDANRRSRVLVEQAGLPVTDTILLDSPITGRVGDRAWLSTPIAYDDALPMAQRLRTACLVVIAYLSGMRAGEVLNLERGCVTHDPVTDLWVINGRKFKGARNEDGEKVPEGQVRDEPWVVVEQTARAVKVLERLHHHRLLFHNDLRPITSNRDGDGRVRPTSARGMRVGAARNAQHTTGDVHALIEWINDYCAQTGRPQERVPADPHGRLAPSRFRRTLAWHIVRKPRGLVAGAIQYGHLHVQMTLGYSGAYDSGFPDEHAFEDWLFRLEQLAENHERLLDGEKISGPAAGSYQYRIPAAHNKFAGRVLVNNRQARDLLANPLLQIYPGKAMTCVFDQSKALCQVRVAEGDVRTTPDQDDCRTNCGNIAYTDRNIDQLRAEAASLSALLDQSIAPSPRHHREQAELDRLRRIVADHGTAIGER